MEIISSIGIESIVTIIVLLILTIYFIITKQWTHLRETAYALMLQVERVMSTSTGKEKMEVVFERFYNLVPKWIKTFIKQESLREKLQEWYNLAKDYIDDAKINNSAK